MQIKSIWVSEYHVLQDFKIDFAAQSVSERRGYNIDFLVGLNGSGKSTVLRLIAEIIMRLEKSRGSQHRFPFSFELVYSAPVEHADRENGEHEDAAEPEPDQAESAEPTQTAQTEQTITIRYGFNRDEDEPAGDSSAEQGERAPIRVQTGTDAGFVDFNDTSVLPGQVIVLTSGQEREWEQIERLQIIEDQQQPVAQRLRERKVIREQPLNFSQDRQQTQQRETRAGSRVTFVRNHQLPLIMLCALLDHQLPRPPAPKSEVDGFAEVLQQSNISRLAGFSLRFRFDDPMLLMNDPEHPIATLLTLCKPTRVLRFGSERLLVFDIPEGDSQRVQAMIGPFSNGWELFRALAPLCRSTNPVENILTDVSVFLERNTAKRTKRTSAPLHLFTWMSDGEQSFLGRMALLSLMREHEALILLDEPEVHFNDYWKRRIGQLIDQTLHDTASHILITTHSSITLTDVRKEDVIKIKRVGTHTTGQPEDVPLNTLAADPSDIMVHVFETGYATGAYAVELISELVGSGRTITSDERERIGQLEKDVAPGYWSYLLRRAMKERPGS